MTKFTDKNQWFTETDPHSCSAFSLGVSAKLHEEQSEYQLIEIYQTELFGKLMVLDGCIMLTQRDNFLYHEMITHPALFTHAAPQKVLIIGGGDCGTLQQVLQHENVSKVTQVEIDRRITELSEIYFPELCTKNRDPRAELLFIDGVKYIKESSPASWDLIIVDSTDPIGPGVKLFETEFYRGCYAALKEGGILVHQSESPLYRTELLCNMHRNMQEAAFEETKTIFFPQPTYPSGWWSCTMAGKKVDLNLMRKDDIKHKNFATRYYNMQIHEAALAVPEFLKDLLPQAK